MGAQPLIVRRLLLRHEQTDFRGGNFVDQCLRYRTELSSLEAFDLCHAAVSRVRNYVGIGLKQLNSQKPICVWRLIELGNSQPFEIGVERVRHWGRPSQSNTVSQSPAFPQTHGRALTTLR